MRVLSIGYQGRSLDGLVATLQKAGATTLVDVRERAWSNRPEFRKGRMTAALEEAGIRYVHLRSAGNPFRPRKGEILSFSECASKYAAHLDEHPEVLGELLDLTQAGPAAIFCYEADHEHCHRSVLLREFQAAVEEVHLLRL